MNTSVIICTYDRAVMLEAALRNLVQVDSPPDLPWEIVIVDNNSTDGTADVIRRWEARSPNPLRLRESRQGKSMNALHLVRQPPSGRCR